MERTRKTVKSSQEAIDRSSKLVKKTRAAIDASQRRKQAALDHRIRHEYKFVEGPSVAMDGLISALTKNGWRVIVMSTSTPFFTSVLLEKRALRFIPLTFLDS
jgi:hypothetical protein